MKDHKILIVDDEIISLRMTDNILKSEYKTVCASSAKEAISIIEESPPDLVLSDLRMPEIDGFKFRIIVQEELGKNIPFMFMTADKKDETESKGFSIGAIDYIRKPFRADVLLRRISNIFANLEQIKGLKKAAGTDPMTGLLNKKASQEEIDSVCKKFGGALMMIDLDSFKPVNDIYGHDMGDKVLIRFAQILCAAIRSTDIAGRMGGDEFVIYCKNIDSEEIVAKKSDFINAEIVKSAKELMGEDMQIPLGASIGCAFAPNEGKDFLTLFKKADKALYDVKQNGKHGYKVFLEEKTEEKNVDEKTKALSAAMMLMGERSPKKGALVLNTEQLMTVYRFLNRMVSNYRSSVFVLLYTIDADTGVNIDEATSSFTEMVSGLLRESDVVTRYSKNQTMVVLVKTEESDINVVIDRIDRKWESNEFFEDCTLSYEIDRCRGT
ncbi:GGDEF domain-containing response regulator [Butyrivibrio sp. VCD2006]|uniref:GGDEF domain-containing response regulator n=1 Tax=Butyrivibrio sp. VCD2006 TaxID=1280664 RepID=UPI0004259278|nr:diguanylate cyclase [Butyrivibrio sp. VCD2006]